MPKIIENLPERLMEAAKRQIAQSGYGALTMRSVARECGVGIGTVYNYYPSKEALVASFMLTDWHQCVQKMHIVSQETESCEPVLACMYEQLQQFAAMYEMIFRDEGAISGFAGGFGQYHTMLRSQLAQPLRKFCRDDYMAEFLAEAMLTWSMEGKEYPLIRDILLRII